MVPRLNFGWHLQWHNTSPNAFANSTNRELQFENLGVDFSLLFYWQNVVSKGLMIEMQRSFVERGVA